ANSGSSYCPRPVLYACVGAVLMAGEYIDSGCLAIAAVGANFSKRLRASSSVLYVKPSLPHSLELGQNSAASTTLPSANCQPLRLRNCTTSKCEWPYATLVRCTRHVSPCRSTSLWSNPLSRNGNSSVLYSLSELAESPFVVA